MVKKDNNIIVGLDIGTTKISTIIDDTSPAGEVEIIGIGVAPSRGLKKGTVVDIDSTVESIKYAVKELFKLKPKSINVIVACRTPKLPA